jgi:hypothetical protein
MQIITNGHPPPKAEHATNEAPRAEAWSSEAQSAEQRRAQSARSIPGRYVDKKVESTRAVAQVLLGLIALIKLSYYPIEFILTFMACLE